MRLPLRRQRPMPVGQRRQSRRCAEHLPPVAAGAASCRKRKNSKKPVGRFRPTGFLRCVNNTDAVILHVKFQFIEATKSNLPVSIPLQTAPLHMPNAQQLSGNAYRNQRKCVPGGVWGGGSDCGSNQLNSLPRRFLWVLSWRNKKVPPPAGMGHLLYFAG